MVLYYKQTQSSASPLVPAKIVRGDAASKFKGLFSFSRNDPRVIPVVSTREITSTCAHPQRENLQICKRQKSKIFRKLSASSFACFIFRMHPKRRVDVEGFIALFWTVFVVVGSFISLCKEQGSINSTNMSANNLPFKTDYAKSGRSKCKTTKQLIPAGTLRVGVMVKSR